MPDLFCPKPFEHFEIQHNAKASLCCPGASGVARIHQRTSACSIRSPTSPTPPS